MHCQLLHSSSSLSSFSIKQRVRYHFVTSFPLYFSREEYVLDEDDYELLEDNNVIAPRRKAVSIVHIFLYFF